MKQCNNKALDNLMATNRDQFHKSNNSSLGYWAAHEQYSMHDLLQYVVEAERNGFTTTMTSDHFHPWWHHNAYGNFAWIWIAAAAERTKRMQFVTGVTAPIYRYHPAIIAQAFASLDILYPGRIGLGLGTGESMNETPLGFDWPRPKVRLKRMIEAAQIISKLWYTTKNNDDDNPNNGDKTSNSDKKYNDGFVYFNGEYFLIRNAKLYSPPSSNHIPIFMAASGPESAKASAKYSDGLITFLKARESRKILDVFDRTIKKDAEGDSNNNNSKQKIAEYKVSYSENYDYAFKSSNFWRATLLEDAFNTGISDPRKLEQKAKQQVPDQKLKESIEITTSIEDCVKSIEDYFKVGFTKVYIHSTSPNEMEFLREFGKKVLPYFQDQSKSSNHNRHKYT
ncbi:MAG TPA: LLM class flavin-dependent oxidoreductase [Nitrososphaeraceae archaeon]|nr:LLM class flavin-dependent oxidoreductase [Nitrososphaeraceae archaeon]